MTLYRQQRRLDDAGIGTRRPWLAQLMPSAVALLDPIYDAQLGSMRASRVKAIDHFTVHLADYSSNAMGMIVRKAKM